MKVNFSSLQKEITEVCPTCGKVSRVTPGRPRGHVPWRHEYGTIPLACGHFSANTYDEDQYQGYYNVELVNEQGPE
jgi:hypothetical protein